MRYNVITHWINRVFILKGFHMYLNVYILGFEGLVLHVSNDQQRLRHRRHDPRCCQQLGKATNDIP